MRNASSGRDRLKPASGDATPLRDCRWDDAADIRNGLRAAQNGKNTAERGVIVGHGASYAGILHRRKRELAAGTAPNVCVANAGCLPPNYGMSMLAHKIAVGSRLRQAIQAVGETPTTISRRYNISTSKIGNWMRGDNYPDEYFIVQFCDRFNVTTDWIYRGLLWGVASGVAERLEQGAEGNSAA